MLYFKHSEKIHTGLPIRCPVTVYKTEDLNLTFSWIYAWYLSKIDSAVFHFALIAKSTRVLIDWSYEIKRQDYVKNG